MTNGRSQRLSEIRSECNRIKNHEDLIAYIESLVEAVDENVFEEHTVRSYLDGIATVLFGMEENAPERPDWKLFGEILRKAFFR